MIQMEREYLDKPYSSVCVMSVSILRPAELHSRIKTLLDDGYRKQTVSLWDNGARGLSGTCVFGPTYKHPSELCSWQFVRNGGTLKTITPRSAAQQVFYYFNDRQQTARQQTQASGILF